MDCAQGSIACDVQQWLTIAIAGLSEAIRYGLDQFNLLIDWIRSQLKELIAIFSFAFAIWRWWRYRESVLHRRLAEYLAEQDRRLSFARDDMLQAIFRPGRRRTFNEPLFAAKSLRNVLRQRRWDALFDFRSIDKSAEHNLDRALGEIDRRLGLAVAALTSLRSQMASAHMLKGAIAAARASAVRDGPQQVDLDNRALIEFRTVLQVHDYERDAQAKEFEAHQLRKLGHLAEADAAYEQLEALTAWISDDRARNLTLARAKRQRAQIAQAQTAGGSDDAKTLIVEGIGLRGQYGPYRDWEGIEQGDTHYVEAYIRRRLGHARIEREQLGLAASAYSHILSQTPRSRWFKVSRTERLRAAAQAGLRGSAR